MVEETKERDLFSRGLALHRAGELREAVDYYRRAIAANPEAAEPYNALGGALANLGETDAAFEALQTAIEKDSSFLDPHLHLATLWRLRGEPFKGEPLLRRALELDNKSWPVWMELGAALMMQNHFAAAAECFEQVLA
ncbi:MAG: tetratricopeptide repeat protein, partial [Gammaproteobacteria bacterium]|nr:tetratricopeptide repeat protein [Gammaproteobacteria bacterium]